MKVITHKLDKVISEAEALNVTIKLPDLTLELTEMQDGTLRIMSGGGARGLVVGPVASNCVIVRESGMWPSYPRETLDASTGTIVPGPDVVAG